nr:MAG TPA: hypothetical protein [Caudoviricetes sp.]
MLVPFGDHSLGNRQNALTYTATHDHVGDPHRMHACEAGDMLLIPAPETVPNGLKSFFSVFCAHNRIF